MPGPIFPLADRNALEDAADRVGELADRIDLMVEGIVALRPCPKPRLMGHPMYDGLYTRDGEIVNPDYPDASSI